MRTTERTTAIQKYFTAFPAVVPSFTLFIQIGIGLFFFGAFLLFFFKNTIITSVIIIFSSIGLFIFWIKPYLRAKRYFQERPPTQEMYKWLINDLNTTIKLRATELLKLNVGGLKSENFLFVPYPIYWPEPGLEPEAFFARETEEEHIFYNVWKIQIIALAQNYISFYSCTYDWINDKILNERTNEFFYDDISSVKNDVEIISKTLVGEEEPKNLNAYVFKVTNMSSENLLVITKIPELKYSPKLEVSLEKAVQALRIILRKRRYNEDQDPIIIEPDPGNEEPENSDEG
jgi:hypothetical protein